MMAVTLLLALGGMLAPPAPALHTGLAAEVTIGAPGAGESRETICEQVGLHSGYKVPADTAEVANDCPAHGAARIVRAIWWGGYTEWEPDDPHITTFHARFYEELDCNPLTLVAEYLSVEPDTFSMGNCDDGLPCYRYELEVDVSVSGPFWFSVQAVFDGKDRYPPKWGRLGDEVDTGCGNRVRPESAIDWQPLDPLRTDVSQAFVIDHPTPAAGSTWGAIKTRFK
jgi:hypothetical protein